MKELKRLFDKNCFKILIEDRSEYCEYRKWKPTKNFMLNWSVLYGPIARRNFAKIPLRYLEAAREFGVQFMETIEEIFAKKETNLEEILYTSQQMEDCVKLFFGWVANNDYKIEYVEEMIGDGYWSGQVDMIVSTKPKEVGLKRPLKILEIKTRNDSELRISDVLQLYVYCCILGVANYIKKSVVIVNKKKLEIKEYEIDFRDFTRAIGALNIYVSTFLGKEYYLNPKGGKRKLNELYENSVKYVMEEEKKGGENNEIF